MTVSTPDTAARLLGQATEALRSAATVATRQLPASGAIEVGQPYPLVVPLEDVVGPGGEALTVEVTGAATGTVAVVLSTEVAAALREGPLAAADLSAALTGPLTEAIAELEAAVGGAIQVGVADAVEADALHFGDEAVAVPVNDGETTVAAMVIDVTAPEPSDEPTEAADDGSGEDAPGDAAVLVPAPVAPAPVDDAPAAGPAQALRPANATGTEEPADFTPFVDGGAPAVNHRSLELLHDVEMAVTVELGRTRMLVSDLLGLAPGAVVELDRAAGSPVDVLVNGKLIARGEVVVVDEDFGIRISEILGLQQSRP